MLPKKRRLTTALFDQVFKSGKVEYSEHLWMRMLPSSSAGSKFAAAISKKVAPTAVERNQIKRKIYQIIEKTIPATKSGFGAIIGVKKALKPDELSKIDAELAALLKKVIK